MDTIITDVIRLINSSLNLEEVLGFTLESATEVMRAEAGSVILLDDESDELVIEIASGAKGGEAQGKRFPKGQGIAGWVVKTGKPRILSDVEEDKHFFKGIDETTGFRTRSILAVPLRVKDEVIGVVEVLNKMNGGLFDEDDLKLFTTLADLAAISINNARIHTELKKTEDSFLDSEERLDRLIEHLPLGVCLLDEKWQLLLANPVGQQYLPALTDADEGEAISHLGTLPMEELAKAEGLPTEVVVEGPQPQIFEVGMSKIRKGRSSGKYVIIIRDVTEENQVRIRAQLQDRLAAVGKLASGISHDFNNILTVMIGFAEVLSMRPDTSQEAKKDLKRIISQGERAAQLIRQILDFSRQTSVKRQPVDLVAFLKEASKLLQQTLPETVRITTEFKDGECIINANLPQLQEVITNLVVNARDAMPTGGEVCISLSKVHIEPGERLSILSSSSPIVPEIEPGDWVVLSVSDTGKGMSPEVMTKIFQPFFTTREAFGGTGLGLSQVYGIVKQHDGYIDVESEVGKGTKFKIYIGQSEQEAAPVELGEIGMPEGFGQTILLVEDQEHVLEVTRDMLLRLNYRVLVASDGRSALEIFDEAADEVDVVLTDVVMPRMGGMELATMVKARKPDIPIILMTGYQPGETEEGSSSVEIASLMKKPLMLHQVAQVVSRALRDTK